MRSDPATALKSLQKSADRRAEAAKKKGVSVKLDKGLKEANAKLQQELKGASTEKVADSAKGLVHAKEAVNPEDFAEAVEVIMGSMPDEHAALLDQAEVRNGWRQGVIVGDNETFARVCKRLKMPLELNDTFLQWLVSKDRPGKIFEESDILQKFIKKGITIPRPEGKLWRQMQQSVAEDFADTPVQQ